MLPLAMCRIRYTFLCGLAFIQKKAGRKLLCGLMLVAGQGGENMKTGLPDRRRVRSQRVGICKKLLHGGSAAQWWPWGGNRDITEKARNILKALLFDCISYGVSSHPRLFCSAVCGEKQFSLCVFSSRQRDKQISKKLFLQQCCIRSLLYLWKL